MHIFDIFKVKKEERWLAFAMLAVFVTFNAMVIASHYHRLHHGSTWWILECLYQEFFVCQAMIAGRG